MEDNIYTLKYDLQQCIAHNMENLETEYTLLFFEKGYMDLTDSLKCFENLEISPYNSKMKFKGDIAKDLKFTEEQLLKVKTIAWKQSMAEAIQQARESQKSEEERFNEQLLAQEQLSRLLEEKQNEEHDFRQATWREKRKLAKIQYELSKIGVELDFEQDEETILLAANVKKLKLNKKQLRQLINYAKLFDIFIIAPLYNQEDEYDNTCLGIRIAFGIDLMI